MSGLALILGIGLVIVGAILLRPRLRARRRETLRDLPTDPTWPARLARWAPLYRRVPASLREQLHAHMRVFLEEKRFIGCAGLSVTDDMRISIAAQACLLLLNRETGYYPRLREILIYPAAFVTEHESQDAFGVHTRGRRILEGESWELGKVVLSWDDALQGAADGDADNVVLHEFAHQLDQEDGDANGAPPLSETAAYTRWSEVCTREFEALRAAAERGEDSFLDPYGAQNPAEFFAVATETFFEQPREMRDRHPDLYEQLRHYYRLDPAEWDATHLTVLSGPA